MDARLGVCVDLKGFSVCWPKDASVKINKKEVYKVDLDKLKVKEPICRIKFARIGDDGEAEIFESLGIYPENLKENPSPQDGLFLPVNLFQAKVGDKMRLNIEGDETGKYEYVCTITDAKGRNVEITGKEANLVFSENGRYRIKVLIRDKKSGKELKTIERVIYVSQFEIGISGLRYNPCDCGNYQLYPLYPWTGVIPF